MTNTLSLEAIHLSQLWSALEAIWKQPAHHLPQLGSALALGVCYRTVAQRFITAYRTKELT